MKLVDQRRVRWQDRAHFFAVAAQQLRRILIDHAWRHSALKRGGQMRRLSVDEAVLAARPAVDLLALDEALGRLAAIDLRQSRIVELRFSGGLTIDECAEVLVISAATVTREWTGAKAWLYRELQGWQEA